MKDALRINCLCQCHTLDNFGWDQRTKKCKHCDSSTKDWKEEFNKTFPTAHSYGELEEGLLDSSQKEAVLNYIQNTIIPMAEEEAIKEFYKSVIDNGLVDETDFSEFVEEYLEE